MNIRRAIQNTIQRTSQLINSLLVIFSLHEHNRTVMKTGSTGERVLFFAARYKQFS